MAVRANAGNGHQIRGHRRGTERCFRLLGQAEALIHMGGFSETKQSYILFITLDIPAMPTFLYTALQLANETFHG